MTMNLVRLYNQILGTGFKIAAIARTCSLRDEIQRAGGQDAHDNTA